MSAGDREDAGDRESVAVIGAGVSGLTAAHLLQRRYDVTLFEADDRLGGHAHTHDVPAGAGTLAVDSGFIVHNEVTYPNLLRLFAELGVSTQDSEMSMSVRDEASGLEYAGARGPRGLFAQPRNLARPRYLRMLTEVMRFHREAHRVLDGSSELAEDVTLGEFLDAGGYSAFFVDTFAIPVVSAVWSAGPELSRQYPARYLFAFLDNHGMLAVGGSHRWRTVTGGSRSYVERAAKGLAAVEVSTPVRTVARHADGVAVRDDADVEHRFDRAVVATHAPTALGMLAAPTAYESAVLGAFRYTTNETWLHTDTSLLPRAAGARASWNLLRPRAGSADDRVVVSYDMTRLQRLESPDGRTHVVTLNATDRIDPSTVIAKMVYEHPAYTPESVAAQGRLPALDDGRVAFAGAYHGWGFHEDGCASGVRAAASLGVDW